MNMLAIDLCAGAGGLSLGLQRAGFDVLGVELDADACETHRANVGPCEQASIVGWHPPSAVDLVAGGVPCTDHSIAGKRRGTSGPTGALYQELIRIGVEANARTLMIENVEGMLSTRDADGWTTVARVEAAMRAAGYEPRRQVLCAADYGTPQLRYRLIIVAFRDPADLDRFRWPEPTHAERPGLFGLRPWVTVREALGLGPGAYRAGLKEGADPASPQGMRFLDVDKPSPTVAHVGELLRPAGSAWARLNLEQRSLLQGFPRGFAWAGSTGESRDKQCGNAVPPQLGEAVGRSIARALRAGSRIVRTGPIVTAR